MMVPVLTMTGHVQADSDVHTKLSQFQPANEEQVDLFRHEEQAFLIKADYLYWVVNEGSLDYAVKMDKQSWSTNSFAVGHVNSAEFDWASGLRFAFGFYRAPHFWDMFLEYTYVPCYGSDKVHAPADSGEYLTGTWSHPDVNTGSGAIPLERAHSRINLNYHVLDFLASRRFYPNPHLRLNTYGGITTAFLFQKWDVYYQDIQNQHSKIRNKWQFEGIGLKFGVKLDWFLGYDLYLTGLASSGILGGWYKNLAYQKTDALIPGADNTLPIHDTHFHDTRLACTAQMMSGFSWQKAFKSLRVELMAGYEFNVWMNLHQIYRSSYANAAAAKETYINESNMSLQGLTIRLNLDL